jgi:hypothetical protein
MLASAGGDTGFDLLISNSRVLYKYGNPLNKTKTKEDELLPTATGDPVCSLEMTYHFVVRKTNRNKEAPVLNERILSFRKYAKGPMISISDKDHAERQISKENLKNVRVSEAELLVQVSTSGDKEYAFIASTTAEFNTIRFLLKLVQGEVEPGNLLETYPRRVLFMGMLEKLVNSRWSPRYIMIIPHRLYSFANAAGSEHHPRNIVPLRNASFRLESIQGSPGFIVEHVSMASPFIFRLPDEFILQSAEVSWAITQASRFTVASPLFESSPLPALSSSSNRKTEIEKSLPLDQFLTFSVKVRFRCNPRQPLHICFSVLILNTQRFDNGVAQSDKGAELGFADEYILQFKRKQDQQWESFDMIFSFKEKVADKMLISTNNITNVAIGAPNSFSLDDIDPKQCACVECGSGTNKSQVILIFQTSFDCSVFVQSVKAILDKSMFDADLTPWPACNRIMIDECVAQKSESIGWGDRYLKLMPHKLLIFSAGKSANAPSSLYPRNVTF